MILKTKEIEFIRLMNELRTEWFIMDSTLPQLTNVNQINSICIQLLHLGLTQKMIDDKT